MICEIRGNVVDVISREVFEGAIIVNDGVVVDVIRKPVEEPVYILPGLINAHVHIESSMLVPSEFAKLAVRHGTVATVSDPHEIANVCGMHGVEYMIENAGKVPFKFHFGAPSCVPATGFETAGHVINSQQIKELLEREDILYLTEMMNFPGVIYRDEEVGKKLEYARKQGKPIDGHAPGLSGTDLLTYAKAGITSDHECTSVEEAEEKIACGIKIQIREGSAAKDYEALWPLIDKYPDMVMLCTDDSHPDDLINGHLNLLLKRSMAKGLDLFNVLRSATVNPKEHYNLNVGTLQKGDPADICVVDSLQTFNVLSTYIDGKLVFNGKEQLMNNEPIEVINNFNCEKITSKQIQVAGKDGDKIRIIEAIDGELVTKEIIAVAKVENSLVVSDADRDFLKIVVVNRYQNTEPVVGFIKNFNLKKGSLAGSIAHDSHNIIAVGTNDDDILAAINAIIESKGGIVACSGDDLHHLPLVIGGIMSHEPGEIVADKYQQLNSKAKDYGSDLRAPFMTLSFMALLVIPSLKIGDKGLFDGNKFELTNLFVD